MIDEEKILEILEKNMKSEEYQKHFIKFRRTHIRNKILFFVFICLVGIVLFPITLIFLAKFIWVSYSRHYDTKILQMAIQHLDGKDNSDDVNTLLTWLKHENNN